MMAKKRIIPASEVADPEPAPAAVTTPTKRIIPASEVADAPAPSVGETVGRHALEGLTMGFSGELGGVGAVIGDRLASWFNPGVTATPVAQAYREGRTEQ